MDEICHLKSVSLDCCDVRVRSVVPVQIAFQIICLADFKSFGSLVDICGAVCQICLNQEGVVLAVLGDCAPVPFHLYM